MKLEIVEFMPKELEEGVLYVSSKYRTAAHLCACGCLEKIRTPLTPTEWTFTADTDGPSLSPSVGNWQKNCRSHYWIQNGRIYWAEQWSEAQIKAGREQELRRRKAYLHDKYKSRKGILHIFLKWLKSLFNPRN